jgi:hypothetical protein
MRNTMPIGIMIAAAIVVIASILLAGCDPQPKTNVTVSPDVEINPVTGQPYQDIAEKRGVITNITEFNELMRRASKINAYKYTLTDTDMGEDQYKIFTLGRFVKIQLPEVQQYSTGEVFDEILMDKQTKTAFSHCSKHTCPKPNIDKELEIVEYDDYYIKDPMEYLYKATDADYVKQEMIGNDYTKVFSIKYDGKPARIWLQEYYGYPLKIMVKESESTKRTIRFEDVTVDATRTGEIDTPTNFTVKGEEGSWIFWKHYLGEWPKKGVNLPLTSGTAPSI